MTQRREPPREALTTPRGHHGTALACQRHMMRLKHAHMGSTTYVLCTLWPQWHGAWCGLPLPRKGTRALKPCAVSQMMKPWAQCHGLMALVADSHRDAYAQHRGVVPCAQEELAMGAMPWFVVGKQATKHKPWAPRHGTGSRLPSPSLTQT